MLTPGNKKLGGRLIWGFGLPSGRSAVCPGLTAVCRAHCYARQVESLRPAVRARYARNLRLSRRPDFERRVRYWILAHEIQVVRLHVGGDFYSRRYARKWLRIIHRLPQVQFFGYTRAWRAPALRPALERLAGLRNCRLWYSCDRETGLPPQVPRRVRLAWLMTSAADVPPAAVDLTFRVRSLRRLAATRVHGVRVCPEEDGVRRQRRVTCDRCRLCWKPLPDDHPGRRPLSLRPS